MILKADGPAVRILWSIDCNEACVTAAVRTVERQTQLPCVQTLFNMLCLFVFSFSIIYLFVTCCE